MDPKCRCFPFHPIQKIRIVGLEQYIGKTSSQPTIQRCARHFREEEVMKEVSAYDERNGKLVTAPLLRPRLVEKAVPSLFPECPAYVSRDVPASRENPEKRRERLENESLSKAIMESQETFEEQVRRESFSNFQEFVLKFKRCVFHEDWCVVIKPNYVCLLLLDESCQTKSVIKVSSDLQATVLVRGITISRIQNFQFPVVLNSVSQLEDLAHNVHEKFLRKFCDSDAKENISLLFDILDVLSEKFPEKTGIIEFVKEQIFLITKKQVPKYSWELVVFSSLILAISPHAYKFMRGSGNLILPSPRTLKGICSSFTVNPAAEKGQNFLLYMKRKVNALTAEDKICILSMDEVHLQPQLQYKQGSVIGNAVYSTECATGAYVFKVSSFLSSYKDVVHIVPVKNIVGEALFAITKNVIEELEELGIEILALTSDNSSLNRKAVSLFSNPPLLQAVYPHPKSNERPLFFAFDSVHILKCIRNNWLNANRQEFIFPDFETATTQKALFKALKDLHSLEISNLLKYGASLSLKALYPTSFERQKVSLALQVFNENTAIALEQVGQQKGIEEWASTSKFIKIVCQWWDIVNVKSPWKGKRRRNVLQEPITKSSCHLDILKKFLNWMELWRSNSCGTLTKETHNALTLTTESLIKMSEYCLNEKNFSYFLTGKVQTDYLEGRFGLYRQLAGSQFNISLLQLYEVENKLRVMSYLSLDNSMSFTLNPVENKPSCVVYDDCVADEDDVDKLPDEIWPVLYYIGGYCSFGVSKRYNCEYCKLFLSCDGEFQGEPHYQLIHAANRGGLRFPHDDVVHCATYVYIVMNLIIAKHKLQFMDDSKQQDVLMSTTKRSLPCNLFMGHQCPKHEKGSMIDCILKISSNILLNNFVKLSNDSFKPSSMSQKKRL